MTSSGPMEYLLSLHERTFVYSNVRKSTTPSSQDIGLIVSRWEVPTRALPIS